MRTAPGDVPAADLDLRPSRVALSASADAQPVSRLFSNIPAEIREMIYVELWRSAGLSQHIIYRRTLRDMTHTPCLVDQVRDQDVRYARLMSSAGPSKQPWEARLQSEWCLHWQCQENSDAAKRAAGRDGTQLAWKTPFLAALLTCKRM